MPAKPKPTSMSSAEMLAHVKGEKYTPRPPMSDEERLWLQIEEEIEIRCETLIESFAEFKEQVTEKLQELEHRISDLEKYAE
jgi:hypothetical protein